MREEMVCYAADGLEMVGRFFVSDDRQGPIPGVLVFPEAFGLGDHALSRAKRLAQMGYAVLACDLHGGGRIIDDLPQVMGLLSSLRQEPLRIRERAKAALTALRGHDVVDGDRVASIGFCFGGTMALELARSGADIVATVGFHSSLATLDPQDASRIKGNVLVCIGADDPAVPAQQRQAFEVEMRVGRVDWDMHLYGGVVHSFTDPAADSCGDHARFRYNAHADKRSWAAMATLLSRQFDRETGSCLALPRSC